MAALVAADLTDLSTRFGALYTGAITDVLDRLGLRAQTLPPELAPLRPGLRLAGPAYPVRGEPREGADYDRTIRKVLEMLGAVPPGHVAVYETNDTAAAQLGELSVTSLKSRGCAGAVVDGGCRDVEFILREDFPVFARYTTPQDSAVRWEVVDHGGRPAEIGGVRVRLGDYVVADHDGVVVVPREAVQEVLAEAEAKAATESEIRTAVRGGMLPLDAYERFGTF
jgi:4-hydroxy-4-methyl-2-oxoglutarate aldolase